MNEWLEIKKVKLPKILMYCPTSIEIELWNFSPSGSVYPAPRLLITASPIGPEVKKNSKEVVSAALLDPRSERAHKPTDEQYPTKWNIWKDVSYQRSLKGILSNITQKYCNEKVNKQQRWSAQVSCLLRATNERRSTSRYFIITFKM